MACDSGVPAPLNEGLPVPGKEGGGFACIALNGEMLLTWQESRLGVCASHFCVALGAAKRSLYVR